MKWIRSLNSHTGPRRVNGRSSRPDTCQHPTTRRAVRKTLLASRVASTHVKSECGTGIRGPATNLYFENVGARRRQRKLNDKQDQVREIGGTFRQGVYFVRQPTLQRQDPFEMMISFSANDALINSILQVSAADGWLTSSPPGSPRPGIFVTGLLLHLFDFNIRSISAAKCRTR